MGNEMKRILPIACLIFVLIAVNAFAGSKPEITKCDIHYSNNAINANIHWQSENPVTKVKIFTGPELKEIAVDEYDNRRNPQGYSGEVSAVIPITNPGEFVAYVVQVEDDLRQKSDQTVGKVAAITKVDPMAAAQINVQQSIQIGQQQQATQIMPVIGAPSWGRHLWGRRRCRTPPPRARKWACSRACRSASRRAPNPGRPQQVRLSRTWSARWWPRQPRSILPLS